MGDILLSDWIEAIRMDLQRGVVSAARRQADEHPLRFSLAEVTLEVNVVSERTGQADGKIKFWVLEAGASAAQREIQTQKVTIKLLGDAPLGASHDDLVEP